MLEVNSVLVFFDLVRRLDTFVFSCVHLVICMIIPFNIYPSTLFALRIREELLKTVKKRVTFWGGSSKCLGFTPF
jgi:hypothetical protein